MKKTLLIATAFLAFLAMNAWPASAQQTTTANATFSAKLICPFYTLGEIAFAFPNMDTSITAIDFRNADYAHTDTSHLDISFIPFNMGSTACLALPSISQYRNEAIKIDRLSLHSE
ncbi:hypothetical protein Mtc_1917 [Methanocella conradii HZ254]|uniref:Uncharacterized protein n=1 Tax=Methanocella conradii (strain DSM 24694 / JCM 17849 / CGMCC 1.5162 / HZ254) TaxID=1041930 RepID=H8I4R2_METCZ|nr:hypothetical protein [Methanocella conradii]AFD00657.1 hypothetical protein Mtc_1917 [Methanocella conradii HZ254]